MSGKPLFTFLAAAMVLAPGAGLVANGTAGVAAPAKAKASAELGDGDSAALPVGITTDWWEKADAVNRHLQHSNHEVAAPIRPRPDWKAEGNQVGAEFGNSVGTAGDVNGDGYADVIVGALFYSNDQAGEGRAFIYDGSVTGLSLTPNWTGEADQGGASFGASVSTAGDVNGDGYDDVIIGASYYSNDQANEGRAFVYHGSPSGLSMNPNWIAEGEQDSGLFGNSVGTAGDVNGDGYADVIIGAFNYSNDQAHEGRVFVYHGSPSGLSATPDWTAEGDQIDGLFGNSVGTAGDVNGDGFSDVIVGAPRYDSDQLGDNGRAFVYLGSASGLSGSPDWTAGGDQNSALFGSSVGTVGDVNHDGYDDVAVGAYGYTNGQPLEGRVLAYYGSATGLAMVPNWTVEGDREGASLGISLGAAGDVNGDGYDDLIVGANGYDHGEENEGAIILFTGGTEGLSARPKRHAEGNQMRAELGRSVGTAGDVNGDGYDDVIAGAIGYRNGEALEGGAVVFHGGEIE